MTMFGIDCATPVTNPGALQHSNVHFVCRYLSTPGNPKNLTPAEAERLTTAGIGIVVVFETTAGRALSGKPGGTDDAHAALEQAKTCGMPAGRPIFFAVDFDPSPAQLPVVLNYLAGAASVLGKSATGVYGGIHVVKAALDVHVCKYAWQTYAWSAGEWDRRAQLQQYLNGQTLAGMTVDFDRATVADYGQWRPPAVRRLVGYTVAYLDRHGHVATVDTKAPTLWQARHPRAKQRGRVTVTRRFKA